MFSYFISYSFFIYDTYTSTSQLSKYERATNILVKLDQIKHYTKTSQEVMNNIYEGLNDIVVAKPFVISVSTRI